MKIEQLTKIFERMKTPEQMEAVKEQMKQMKKETKSEQNKKYYENYKNRIIAKNTATWQEKYENDPEFNAKVRQQNRERYLMKKMEAQSRKEDMLNKLSEEEKHYASVLEYETSIEDKKKRKDWIALRKFVRTEMSHLIIDNKKD